MAEGDARHIRESDAVLIDVHDAPKLSNAQVGDLLEIGGHRARVVGRTDGIVGFTTTPYVFTTLERARSEYLRGRLPAGAVTHYLVRLRPGADPDLVCEKLRSRLPGVRVCPREEMALAAMHYWLTRTGVGISFGLAAVLGLLVGLAIVTQTFYAAVAERSREFATMKAMGASDRAILRYLLTQAVINAAAGSILGLLLTWTIGRAITTPRAPVVVTWWIVVGSWALVLPVCLFAAWLPYRRIRGLDPAGVLRS
jgi:putative ABC transport system permease protein